MYHMYNFSENIALTLKKQLTLLIERGLKYSIEETRERSASGGGLPYKMGGDARREISIEPLKGTILVVA